MTRFDVGSASSLAILLMAITACGNGRQLRSVSVSPATADAKNFAGGQVQFTATGTFSKAPSPAPVTNPEIFWCVGGAVSAANPTAGVCSGNTAQFASVDQTGLAQCSPSPPQQTTVYVLAGIPEKPLNPDIGPTLKIYGSAQLTCP
jgi:hypothetical protein